MRPRTSLELAGIALLDPHRVIARQARALGRDAFEVGAGPARITCITGAAAAERFYDPELFVRRGALPEPVRSTVFGDGGVQGLDGEAHARRKALFLAIVTPDAVRGLLDHAEREWVESAQAWASAGRIVLYDEVRDLLARAVCRWAGVPVVASDVGRTARDLALLFEGVIPTSPRHLAARRARGRLERWATDLVEAARDGRVVAAPDSALTIVAGWTDLDGSPLPPHVAAVELLSVLRPTVAVAGYVTFAALALHRHREWRTRLADPGPDGAVHREAFAQEVRRAYPFVPGLAARVRTAFAWSGLEFPAGRLVILDVWGTNHDPRLWPDPTAFLPERFLGRPGGAFDLIPQGGGEPATGHRCPGEPQTVGLVSQALELLAGRLAWEVPPQDLRLDPTGIPALPRSRMVLEGVRLAT